MASKIKSVKDLKKLPSGNFLDTKTRVVWGKAIIEKEFAEELATIKDVEKVAEKPKVAAKAKSKSKAKK
jgi:hypothetical protein